jgi:chromosome segregation ATPase
MPEIHELEARLATLRRQVDDAKRAGSTPSQIRKLQAECWQL